MHNLYISPHVLVINPYQINGPLALILSGWYSIHRLPIEPSSTYCFKMINLLKFLSTT